MPQTMTHTSRLPARDTTEEDALSAWDDRVRRQVDEALACLRDSRGRPLEATERELLRHLSGLGGTLLRYAEFVASRQP